MDSSLRCIERSVVALNDESGHSIEVFDPRVERGQPRSLGRPVTVFLIESDARIAGRRRLDDMGRWVAVENLKPAALVTCEHNLLLHARERGSTGLRSVSQRSRLGVVQHPADFRRIDRRKGRNARFPRCLGVIDLNCPGDVPAKLSQ